MDSSSPHRSLFWPVVLVSISLACLAGGVALLVYSSFSHSQIKPQQVVHPLGQNNPISPSPLPPQKMSASSPHPEGKKVTNQDELQRPTTHSSPSQTERNAANKQQTAGGVDCTNSSGNCGSGGGSQTYNNYRNPLPLLNVFPANSSAVVVLKAPFYNPEFVVTCDQPCKILPVGILHMDGGDGNFGETSDSRDSESSYVDSSLRTVKVIYNRAILPAGTRLDIHAIPFDNNNPAVNIIEVKAYAEP